MTKTTDLDSGKTNNLKHFWDVLEYIHPLLPLCPLQRKKVQYETNSNCDFTQWDVLPSFRQFHIEVYSKKKNYIKREGLRNVLFISITNTGTCFSRRIGLIKSFTTQASSYLFLSLELQYLAFVIKWTWYPYLVWQLEVTKWRIISFYKIFSI